MRTSNVPNESPLKVDVSFFFLFSLLFFLFFSFFFHLDFSFFSNVSLCLPHVSSFSSLFSHFFPLFSLLFSLCSSLFSFCFHPFSSFVPFFQLFPLFLPFCPLSPLSPFFTLFSLLHPFSTFCVKNMLDVCCDLTRCDNVRAGNECQAQPACRHTVTSASLVCYAGVSFQSLDTLPAEHETCNASVVIWSGGTEHAEHHGTQHCTV